MLSKEEWNANKDSTSIIYCFEDGTTKEITMAEYLRAHPEHSAEDFRIIKELSDELLHTFYLSDYRAENYLSDLHLKQLRSISHPRNWGRWKACCEKNSFALLFV